MVDKYNIKKLLNENQYSCVLLKDGNIIMTSFEKGIAPLYNYIKSYNQLTGGYIHLGDKIIGRASAFLAIYLGVSYIYTDIISETSLDILKHYNIEVEYGHIVPYIENRKKDGQCPMEQSLEGILDVNEGIGTINEFILKRDKMKNI